MRKAILLSRLLTFLMLLLLDPAGVWAQNSFMDEPGIPVFTAAFPVEHGFINLANGNLHIEIPIATYPQRGNIKALHARLVYDSRFWIVQTDPVSGISTWMPNGIAPIGVNVGGGFRLITDVEAGNTGSSQSTQICAYITDAGGVAHPQYKTTFTNFTYQEPNGTMRRTNHSFKLYLTAAACGGAQVPTGTAYAVDNSGYKFVITNGNIAVYAPDGAQVAIPPTSQPTPPGFPTVQDTNGNYYSYAQGQTVLIQNVVDTLGRIPVIVTSSGSQTFLDYLCEPATQGCDPANGNRARVVLNTATPNWTTHFNQSQGGVVGEYSGLAGSALTSIVFPDGSSYQFQQDSYGMITSMTLPTGGQITYGYTNFTDYAGNVNRWVTSKTMDGNAWTFSPANLACTTPPCPLQVTVTTPPYNDGTTTAGDNHVYVFLVQNQGVGSGSWNTQVQYFRGSPTGTAVLTKTIDYSGSGLDSCPIPNGGASPLPVRETLTWPSASGTLSKKAEYCYDGYANLTTQKMWDYQPNGNFAASPDREIDNVYKTDAAYINANILRLLTSSTRKNSSGTQVAQTAYAYDEGSVQPSGITTNHVTPTTPRANLTSVSRWLNTTGGSVTSSTIWYDTGEVYQSKDPLTNTTTFTYDAGFAGAYPTKVCNALSQCTYNGYDFNTGIVTAFTDANGSASGDPAHTATYTYDSMLRPLCTNLPDGGQTCLGYPNPNKVEQQKKITSGLTDIADTILDDLGRVSQTQHTLPNGVAKVDTTYDPVGALATLSNPYFTTSDPTYGVTQSFHDALGRMVATVKQDGSLSAAAYSVANSGNPNGICTTTTDEAGKQRRACSDGLGRLIEVDEPQSSSLGTNATASVTITGGLQTAANSGSSPQLPAAGSPLASLAPPDGSTHIFFLGANQFIYDLYWFNGGGWENIQLAAVGGEIPAAANTALSAMAQSDGTDHVFFEGGNQHIYDLNYHSGAGWRTQDLSAITGNTLAVSASPLAGSAPASGIFAGNVYLFYLGGNQHIYCMLWSSATSSWQNVDMTALTGALPAAGSKLSVSYRADSSLDVFYLGANQHVYDMVWSSSNGWQNRDLTAITGNTLAAAGSSLTSDGGAAGNPVHLYYLGTNQHIYCMLWGSTSSAWGNVDLTAATGNTLAAAATQLSDSIFLDGTTHVFYLGPSQHVYQLLCCAAGWQNQDLNAVTGSTVPAAGNSLTSFAPTVGLAAGAGYLMYLSGNQHVYSMIWNQSWQNVDVTPLATNLAIDSGTVSLSVGSFTASACYGPGSAAACSGQPENINSSDVASALTQALNTFSSPVSATVSGSSISLIWKTPGPINPAVSALSTSHDNPGLFPNPSFTSPATNFSGGTGSTLSNPSVTLYAYDALGNLLRVDQKGSAPSDSTQWRTRLFTYDSLSRLLTAYNPESGTITYSYDADGNLLQKTSPAPNQTGSSTQTISYCYDALNRVTGRAYSAQSCPLSSPVVSYAYDSGANGIGHLTSLADQAGSGSFTYDVLGRMAGEQRVIAGISKSMSYSYNLDSSLKTLTYPSGAVVTYTVDSAGRDVSAVDSGNAINYVTSASYGPDSALTGFVSGYTGSFAGITNSFSYNKRLQPINMSASSPGATVFWIGYDFHLGAGDNGNVWGITNNKDTTRNQAFTYDALNRLTSAQNAGTDCTQNTVNGKTKFWGNNYGYDAWGNLLSKSVTKCSAENLSVTAAANNQLQGGYIYDAAGNMTHDATANLNYSFDQENRITGAAGYTYTYDGDGNRVEKANGSAGTLYWYLAPGIVAESNLAGTIQSEYVFFDGERVARRDESGNTGVFYYFSDHLKTASVITDAAGNIMAESDYYPWGGELQFTNNDSNHYKFTGKERDAESGLDYFGARYYSSGLGRFISADWSSTPIPVPYADLHDPQSLNLYRYPSNPETYADPDGHCDWCQKLKNFVSFNGWNTDTEVEQKQKEYDQSVRDYLVNQYGLNRKDVDKLTPKQADKLSDALDAGHSEVTVDGVKVVVQAVAQAAAVVPPEVHHELPQQFKEKFD